MTSQVLPLATRLNALSPAGPCRDGRQREAYPWASWGSVDPRSGGGCQEAGTARGVLPCTPGFCKDGNGQRCSPRAVPRGCRKTAPQVGRLRHGGGRPQSWRPESPSRRRWPLLRPLSSARGWRLLLCAHVVMSPCVCALISASNKATSQIGPGPTPMTSVPLKSPS